MKNTEKVIKELSDEGLIENIAVFTARGDKTLFEYYSDGVNADTLFDMASVTKILSVTQLALIATERGLISESDGVDRFFECARPLTVGNLLTHTMGIGHKNLCQPGVTYDNVAEYILSLEPDVPVGTVIYSCPAFILMGKILEKVFGGRLDALFDKMVAAPLGLTRTGFLPKERKNIVNANDEPELAGVVNDYNCRYLGGVAGNAGIFSCVSDLKKFCKMLTSRGAPLYGKATFDRAATAIAASENGDRGLGFLVADGKYRQTGALMPAGSVGHCGHTGQLVFADPASGLYTIILTDATKHAPHQYERVKRMRERLCDAIASDVE